jgi:Raf kinase inhibitor-like YbhB/YbcL family protein
MRPLWKITMLAIALGLIGAPRARSDEVPSISVSSAAFAETGIVPKRYTCEDADMSPPLAWSGVPAGTKTLALIAYDPDAPSGVFTHWVVYNLPSGISILPENLPRTPTLDSGGLQALNDFGHVGYNGPCPPPGPRHHYHFKMYALAIALHLANGADARSVGAAMRGHVLASGETVGWFKR